MQNSLFEYIKSCDKKIKEKIKKLLENDTTETEENKVLQKIISELEYSAQVAIELNDRYHKALEEIKEAINNADI